MADTPVTHRPGPEAAEAAEAARPHLMAIAYRMLGSVSDAEDVVQDAYVRLHDAVASGTHVRAPRAFLATVTTRLAIDELRSARKRRETYFGPWLPEPLLTPVDPDAERRTELAGTLSMSSLLLLEALSPPERAVFLLRDVFDYDFAEIAAIVARSEANCRQILVRARRRIAARTPRFAVSPGEAEALAERFIAAVTHGDVQRLVELLADDVVFYGDGGGKARGVPQPVRGRDRVGRLLGAIISELADAGGTIVPAAVNGEPGFLFLDAEARLISVAAFDVDAGSIRVLRIIINPDKLRHLGYEPAPGALR